jgi:hypothetical protein
VGWFLSRVEYVSNEGVLSLHTGGRQEHTDYTFLSLSSLNAPPLPAMPSKTLGLTLNLYCLELGKRLGGVLAGKVEEGGEHWVYVRWGSWINHLGGVFL